MTITDDKEYKAMQVRLAVYEFFLNSDQSNIKASELSSFFLNKGIFGDDGDNPDPILKFLYNLEEANLLKLVPQAFPVISESGMDWYFIKSP